MRARFIEVAQNLLDENPRIAVCLADISASQFASAARRHPDRVVNFGIREQLMIGAVGGLALTGLRPIAHSFSTFLIERPWEQVKLDLSHQGVGAILVSAGASYDGAAYGRTHHSPGDVALLDTLDGWTVHIPGHPDEAEAQLRDAAAGEGLVYIRLSTQQNRRPVQSAPGRFEVVRRGSLGTIVAVGPLLDSTVEAAAELDVTLLYAATVRPFDAKTLLATLSRPDIVLVEPYLAGTSSHQVTEALREIPHRILGLGVGRQDLRRYGTAAEHNRAHGLDAEGIRRSIASFLRPPS
jgi:transketolase